MSQNYGLYIFKLSPSVASIALKFDGLKRTESYKNENSNILVPKYKQMNPTLFHINILNSFKKVSNLHTSLFIWKDPEWILKFT